MYCAVLNLILLICFHPSKAQLQGRLNIPMGVPDLDDRYSQGLANYIGISALPGQNSGTFGDPISLSGRSGGPSSDSSNSLSYNDFPSLPGMRGGNRDGMTKWYGPAFEPPAAPAVPGQGGPGSGMNGMMMPPNMMGGSNFPMMPPQQPPPQSQPPPPLNDGSVMVSDLTCQKPRSIIGMSNDRNHWLSTVECECRPGDVASPTPEFACYSLCNPPPTNQRCEATFSILTSCPTYTNCQNWTQSNDTDGGAVTCTVGTPVPESMCWILASAMLRADDRPLRPAFYANAATGCYMACICGNDGTVAGEIQCLKRPTSHWRFPVYPRKQKFDFSQSATL